MPFLAPFTLLRPPSPSPRLPPSPRGPPRHRASSRGPTVPTDLSRHHPAPFSRAGCQQASEKVGSISPHSAIKRGEKNWWWDRRAKRPKAEVGTCRSSTKAGQVQSCLGNCRIHRGVRHSSSSSLPSGPRPGLGRSRKIDPRGKSKTQAPTAGGQTERNELATSPRSTASCSPRRFRPHHAAEKEGSRHRSHPPRRRGDPCLGPEARRPRGDGAMDATRGSCEHERPPRPTRSTRAVAVARWCVLLPRGPFYPLRFLFNSHFCPSKRLYFRAGSDVHLLDALSAWFP